jgi:hypothetical protein
MQLMEVVLWRFGQIRECHLTSVWRNFARNKKADGYVKSRITDKSFGNNCFDRTKGERTR